MSVHRHDIDTREGRLPFSKGVEWALSYQPMCPLFTTEKPKGVLRIDLYPGREYNTHTLTHTHTHTHTHTQTHTHTHTRLDNYVHEYFFVFLRICACIAADFNPASSPP